MDDRVPEHRDSHTSSSHEPSLEPTLPRSADLGKHNVYTHFPKDRNCEICKRTNITRTPCRRRNGGAVPRAENLGHLITADHKVLSEGCESRNNHRYAVVVQDLATQWIQSYPSKTKTSQETQTSLQKFLEPNRKPKVLCTDNSLEFGKACEDLSWNQLLLSAKMFKISCLIRRHHTKGVLENHLKDQLFRLVHWLSITLFLRKTNQESINLERKSYLDCSSDTLCTWGEFGRVTY